MAQVKKEAVRDAILDAAGRLFTARGYSDTSLAQIAEAAGVSTSNIYVYFASKLEILFAIYDPWLRERLTALAAELEGIDGAEARLRRIFEVIWRELPAEHNGFANNLMQALSTATPDQGYSRELLLWSEDQVARMIGGSLPPGRLPPAELEYLSHLAFMAFDGFVMNHKLNGPSRRVDRIVALTLRLLLGKGKEP
jgi:AcrR family transcriptional regulator